MSRYTSYLARFYWPITDLKSANHQSSTVPAEGDIQSQPTNQVAALPSHSVTAHKSTKQQSQRPRVKTARSELTNTSKKQSTSGVGGNNSPTSNGHGPSDSEVTLPTHKWIFKLADHISQTARGGDVSKSKALAHEFTSRDRKEKGIYTRTLNDYIAKSRFPEKDCRDLLIFLKHVKKKKWT